MADVVRSNLYYASSFQVTEKEYPGWYDCFQQRNITWFNVFNHRGRHFLRVVPYYDQRECCLCCWWPLLPLCPPMKLMCTDRRKRRNYIRMKMPQCVLNSSIQVSFAHTSTVAVTSAERDNCRSGTRRGGTSARS